jgi:5-methylcytosine-specific restriction endonuclease McrA
MGVADASSGVPGKRVRSDSLGWFLDAGRRRTLARRERRCAECWAPLESPRATYCSEMCRWRFHGRYFWDSARVAVFRRDHYTCQACHARRRRRDLEVDHIVEIARGGPSLDYANLQTLCRECHRTKTRQFLRGRPRSGAPALPAPPALVARGERVEEPDWFPA